MVVVEFVGTVLLWTAGMAAFFGFLFLFAVIPMTYLEDRFHALVALLYMCLFVSTLVVGLEYVGFFVEGK
jgi:hypothetical protein